MAIDSAASKPFCDLVSAWTGAPSWSHSEPGPSWVSISRAPLLRPISSIWSSAKGGISARLPCTHSPSAGRSASTVWASPASNDCPSRVRSTWQKVSSSLPISIRSPLARACASTRLPLTKVPLVLPRSRSRGPSGPGTISACRRLASGLASVRVHVRLRPITSASSVGTTTGGWGGRKSIGLPAPVMGFGSAGRGLRLMPSGLPAGIGVGLSSRRLRARRARSRAALRA